MLAMGGLPPTKSAASLLDSASSTKKAAHSQHHLRPSGYSLMDPPLDTKTSTPPTSSTPSQMQDKRPLETTSLHSESRAATSSLWVLHLHVAKVGLRILVYLNSSFCPHLQVIIDLMLSQRLIDLRSLFIYFAVVDIFMIY